MKNILLVFLFLLLFGCRPVYNLTSTEFVRVEVHDTTVFTKLVPIFEKIKTKDTVSHLENIYAFSDVSLSSGILTHSLGIKAANVPVVVPIKTIYKDRVKVVEKIVEREKIVKVEKPLTRYQSFAVRWMTYLLVALGGVLIYGCIRLYLKFIRPRL